MFFSGDPSSKRKVDLGGRSSKERDRGKLLEIAKDERKKRQRFRLETQSAIIIQKVFRGRRAVAAERQTVRKQFCAIYGEHGEKIDKNAFKVESKCLTELIFFYQSHEKDDFLRLTAVCRALHQSLIEAGDLDTLLSVDNPSLEKSLYNSIVEHRVKNLSYLCIVAIHHYRDSFRQELLSPIVAWDRFSPALLLLQTVLTLTDTGVSWSGVILDFLYKNKLFVLLRELLQTVSEESCLHNEVSCLEHAVILLAHRNAGKGQNVKRLDSWSFTVQILSIPLVFQKFPSFKQVIVSKGLWASSVWQLSSSLPEFIEQLPQSMSAQFPSSVCLLGNLLEVSGPALSLRDCPLQLAVSFATVSRCLMEVFSSQYIKSSDPLPDEDSEENMEVDARESAVPIDKALEDQLLYASKPDVIKNLVRIVFPDISVASKEKGLVPSSSEAAALAEICGFFFTSFSLFPNSGAITTLAYSTQLVSYLWHYMERCNSAHEWPIISLQHKSDKENYPGMEMDGLLLPLSVFCPVYSHMLLSLDNEEFYEQQKPLQLGDLRILIIILKEALWQLLWVLPSKLAPTTSASLKKVSKSHKGQRVFSSSFFRQRVSHLSSTLLAQLQDWNNRRQYTPPQDFYAREAMDELFFAQVEHENSRARDLLYQAPFLIPFTHRVRIYTAQLNSAKQHDSRSAFSSRLRIQIRRDRIVEDAFASLSSLSEEALQGTIRVSFVNEFGVEEAGVDGGGIFKDFMENITKAAFDIQYGLFKETPDHLLYPNPASHMVHDEHLQYFEFMGKILGKAMFEGILVDIPFATFFLSKLKKKHNYLHDLQSLDPELYRSLLFLKRYEGDLAQLGLYFVIENNEYGEQVQVELLPGGKDIQVDNDNVIRYIHLVANYRLNTQIRQQSYFFLRGFQQLIQSKWIDMFNEHELQLLISGSVEGLNVDDLRSNANYSGGYSEDHPVIEVFWEIVKTFDSHQQQMFLKFVTGCSRGPLLGFKYLDPQFCIQRAGSDNVSDEMLDRLPTSATCINLLKLPPYTRKEVLKAKLLYAINADAGFDLS